MDSYDNDLLLLMLDDDLFWSEEEELDSDSIFLPNESASSC